MYIIIFKIIANYKVCDQTDDFVNYSTLITSSDFKKKIEQCEMPNCQKKKYHTHEFFEKYEDGKNTTSQIDINHHGLIVQANDVNSKIFMLLISTLKYFFEIIIHELFFRF